MLTLNAVTKRYGGVVALDGIDLSVEPGETVCLLGANGAGKTTTLNLLLGFIAPDGGEVRVGGVDPFARPAEARTRIGWIPENVALYPNLSGLENLAYFDAIGGRRTPPDRLRELLAEQGLDSSQMDRLAQTYSKGMRQRVGLAIALSKGADALLLDEPMSGLDPKAASEFTARLDGLQRTGKAVLMATHDIFRAKECATRIGIMRSGRLVESIEAAVVDATEIERLYLAHMHAERAA